MGFNYTPNLMESFIVQINLLNLKDSASIILIGGNDSYLAECLLEKGFKNITILDESVSDQRKKKTGLGEMASEIKWVICKVSDYVPVRQFDLWCDCTTFFMLNKQVLIDQYVETAKKVVSGFIIISTFSEYGCREYNGLVVKHYKEYDLSDLFKSDFIKFKSIKADQATSYNLNQNFLVSILKHKSEQ